MIRHTCMNIDGAIANANDLCGCIMVNGYTLDSVAEVTDWLKKQKAKGYRVLPMCNCNNFDFQTGCQGHETQEECDEHTAICMIAEAICEEDECSQFCGVYTECKAYQKAKEIYKKEFKEKKL